MRLKGAVPAQPSGNKEKTTSTSVMYLDFLKLPGNSRTFRLYSHSLCSSQRTHSLETQQGGRKAAAKMSMELSKLSRMFLRRKCENRSVASANQKTEKERLSEDAEQNKTKRRARSNLNRRPQWRRGDSGVHNKIVWLIQGRAEIAWVLDIARLRQRVSC